LYGGGGRGYRVFANQFFYIILSSSAPDLLDPHTASDSATVERIQRRFLFYTSYALNIPHPLHDYSPVIHELDLLTDRKRINSNIRLLQNLIGGSAETPSLLSLINFCVPPRPTRSIAPFLYS